MNIGVVGATGAVGREMLIELEESSIGPMKPKLRAFASKRSAGQMLEFLGESIQCEEFSLQNLEGVEYVLMSAGGGFSRKNSMDIANLGIQVIDNSSAWRLEKGVPLVVPEVNEAALEERGPGGAIIANPNCSTIQMVVAVKPLKDAFGLKSINVSTYQSVSGSGQKGLNELASQVRKSFNSQPLEPEFYDQPIAFNVLPAIDRTDDEGHCFEEEKMIRETRKIFGLPELEVLATTVRVPVFHCHCESVTVELAEEVSLEDVLRAFCDAQGVNINKENDHKSFPTPLTVVGKKEVYVTRVRLPLDQKKSNRVQFWIVADNLKKGAATNAVQILESLIRNKAEL